MRLGRTDPPRIGQIGPGKTVSDARFGRFAGSHPSHRDLRVTAVGPAGSTGATDLRLDDLERPVLLDRTLDQLHGARGPDDLYPLHRLRLAEPEVQGQ